MSLDLKKRMRINSSENGMFFFLRIYSKITNDQVFMNIQAKRVKNNQGYTFNQNDLDSEDELTVLSPKTPTRYRKINSQTGIFCDHCNKNHCS